MHRLAERSNFPALRRALQILDTGSAFADSLEVRHCCQIDCHAAITWGFPAFPERLREYFDALVTFRQHFESVARHRFVQGSSESDSGVIVFREINVTHWWSFLARSNVVKIRSSLKLFKNQTTSCTNRAAVLYGSRSTYLHLLFAS